MYRLRERGRGGGGGERKKNSAEGDAPPKEQREAQRGKGKGREGVSIRLAISIETFGREGGEREGEAEEELNGSYTLGAYRERHCDRGWQFCPFFGEGGNNKEVGEGALRPRETGGRKRKKKNRKYFLFFRNPPVFRGGLLLHFIRKTHPLPSSA